MRASHVSLAVAVFAVAIFTPLIPAAGADSADESLSVSADEVIRVSRARQAKVRSARFEWKERIFQGKGTLTDAAGPQPVEDRPAGITPPADIRFDNRHFFAFDGLRTNHLSTEGGFDNSGRYYDVTARYTYSEDASLMLQMPTVVRSWPYGRIYPKDSPNHEYMKIPIEPVLQVYRIFDEQFSHFNPQEFRVEAENVFINDVRTVVFETKPGVKGRRIFWLDADREFLPIRFVRKNGENVSQQTDFEYVAADNNSWVLKGWTTERFDNNLKGISTFAGRVSKSEINLELPPSEFKIEFPVGTNVDNLQKGLTHGENYIQRAGGKIRRVLPSENGAKYEELLATEEGGAAKKSK